MSQEQSDSKGDQAKPNDSKKLTVISAPKRIASNPDQWELDLGIVRQIEIEDIGMGVLSDGTPFLSGRGLARLCGVSNSKIVDIGNEWNDDPPKPRIETIKKLLAKRGENVNTPYIELHERVGNYNVYTDKVSLAILEYYAFEAGANVREEARDNFRTLAGTALREFIYAQVGYDPDDLVPDVWKQFHDRISLTYNAVPIGYFSVFKEMSDMILTLGQHGLQINDNFVPDISVGQTWAKHWAEKDLYLYFGERVQWEHNYPDYFPQAKANPQPAWAYPETSLAEFRRWLRENYIGDGKFTQYLDGKVKRGELPPSFAQLAIAAYVPDEPEQVRLLEE